MGHLANAGILIIQVLFGLAISLFFFRLLMQGLRVDFRNPVSQFVYRATNPVLMPIQKMLPVIRGWNLAAVMICLLLMVVQTWLVYWISVGALPWPNLLVVSFALLIEYAASALFFLVLIRVILSWVSPDPRNPVVQILIRLTDPMMKPFRRLIPPLGGFDISPVFLMLALQLVRILIAAPLLDVGQGLSFGG